MPDEPKKPVTRSSIRQSLNLASVGKVLADAIGKDTKDAKKASRRSSALPAAPRASMGDPRPPSQVSKRTATPDAKTVTRRRVSATYARSSSDEKPSASDATSPNPVVPSKPSTLRPKNPNASSALPKYRPKSAVAEPAKPPSPVRAGTRRRLSSSTSDDEKKEQKRPGAGAPASSSAEKTQRPISPLPQRAALKASNVANSLDNRTPPATPSSKPRLTTPVKNSSPSRPSKIVKTNASTSIPRPPSSSSSSLSLQQPINVTPKSSTTPKTSTPKSTGLKAKLGLSRSAHGKSKSVSSTPNSSPSRNSPSPLTARHGKKASKPTSSSASNISANMSHISECTSEEEDSDADDVALLLAPVAAIGAPTPAMPRIQPKKRTAPQTPSRSGSNLPSRDKMSYLSPLPPGSADKSSSSSFLRPPRQQQTANERAMRGSILSWEQLANDTSITLGEDEFGRMLSEVPAPFRSTPASPTLSSQLEIPESPLLTALDSPGGYGSISQVLLPDVTPSPSMHYNMQQSKFSLTPDAGAVESSTTTMLRLQLAAAENTSKERLYQIQAMEEELYHLKQAHAHQLEEAQKQIAYIESQSQSLPQSQSRSTEDHASAIARLEDQLRQAHISREQAIAAAIAQCEEEARAARKVEALRCETASLAGVACSSWGMVHDACEVELDAVRNDKAVLAVLLGQLDQLAAVV